MTMGRLIANVGAVCALVTFGVTGSARAQDRPDLLDVPFTSVLATPPAGYSYNVLLFNLDETTPPSASTQSRVESANAFVEKPGADHVGLRLYEPDSVSRKSNQAKLKQSDNLSLFVRLAASSITASGVVTGCKGQAQVKKNVDAHPDVLVDLQLQESRCGDAADRSSGSRASEHHRRVRGQELQDDGEADAVRAGHSHVRRHPVAPLATTLA